MKDTEKQAVMVVGVFVLLLPVIAVMKEGANLQ
jgi:hypothetical protein